MKRAILIVLDSLGIGALPDGDPGSNTLRSIVTAVPDIKIPNLCSLGLSSIEGVSGLEIPEKVIGCYLRLKELSKGKDTITGHMEIAGIFIEKPFKTFEKYPDSFIKSFEKAIGTKTLGNYAASGTEIIKELGEQHKKTGYPIVYTSADSVFQVAANTDVIPLKRLYEICRIARNMLTGDMNVGRVIARPFIVKDGEYIRTSDRKDYALSPPKYTLLDNIKKEGKGVCAIGKISDIFNNKGITKSIKTRDNLDGINNTISEIKNSNDDLIFTNLVDFDSKYGHRRDCSGYACALEEFDDNLPEIMDAMRDEDILILCADHGNDPGYEGWDHTREYIPVLFYGKNVKKGKELEEGETFADIGATIADYLEVKPTEIGRSRLKEILI